MFTDTFYYQFTQLCEYKTLKDKNIKNNYFQVRSVHINFKKGCRVTAL